MKRVFIGHRGTGKSSLLQRHKIYFPDVPAYDLDQEIENTVGKKVSDIFLDEGESTFRKYELEIFKKLVQKEKFVISVGGGFAVEKIPAFVEVIFVSRRTDSEGRIFLNRPLIHTHLSDLEDSIQLYHQRQNKFLDRADRIYHLPEGLSEPDAVEKKILSQLFYEEKAYLTVVKNNSYELQHPFLELRTDLLSKSDILNIVDQNQDKKFIISFRNPQVDLNLNSSNVLFDWALELGEPSRNFLKSKNIISIHESDIHQAIEKLRPYPEMILKLCPVIHSWEELILGYRWQQEDPTQRNFLPRTAAGKSNYRWFRQLALNFQKINFVQGFVDMDDQPSSYEILNFNSKNHNGFGAVLGNPIHHSWTPVEQGRHMPQPILAIPLVEKDYHLALEFLKELGLKFAAVTSPLKDLAQGNSLVLNKGQWLSTSTDHFGFRKLIQQIPAQFKKSFALWGGGGVVPALKKEIPGLQCYAARSGQIKDGVDHQPAEVLFWAAPRHHDVIFPSWKPQIVLDLNYVDHSMGLEYAKKNKINYISGIEMFKEQARHQREFWKEHL